MKTLLNVLRARWLQLQQRERRLAVWCGIIVLGAALLTLEDWQRSEQLRLKKVLPAAEARLAFMQLMADEYRGFAAKNRSVTTAITSAELLASSVKAAGWPLEVTVAGPSRLVLKGTAPFDDWVDWLAKAATQGWRVETATVQRDTEPLGAASGAARIEATLGAATE